MKDNTIPLELNTTQGSNRFKYQNFKTRVERIKVDIVRRSGIIDDEPDEHGSFFYEALLGWKDLNMTTHFKEFAREITPLVKSLPSIIHHKDTIVDILEKHLKVKDSLALDGLLDLVTKLAKDLEGEFYPYYPRLLSCIIPLVYHQDIKLLENVFNCIAYLFKFLSRQILPDLKSTFYLLSKLLGEDNQTKPYIRHFTAEAFAFLLRKTRGEDLSKIITVILDSLKADPSEQYEEGLAMLFFEAFRQIDHHVHSRGIPIYKELLAQAYKEDVSAEELPTTPVQKLLMKTTLLTLHHTFRQYYTPIIDLLLNDVKDQLKTGSVDEKILSIQVSLLTMFVTVRKASRVENMGSVMACIQDIARLVFTKPTNTYSNYLYSELIRSITGSLCHGSLEVVSSTGRVLLDIVNKYDNTDLVYGFYLSLAKLEWRNMTQIALPYIIKYISTHLEASPYQTILFFSEILATGTLTMQNNSFSSSFTPEGLIRFPAIGNNKLFADSILNIMNSPVDWKTERDLLNATDPKSEECQISKIPILASALSLLPKIQVSDDSVFVVLMNLFTSLSDFLQKDKANNVMISSPYVVGHINYVLETLLGLFIQSLADIAKNNEAVFTNMKNIHEKLINEVLLTHSANEVVLSGVFNYLDLLSSREGNISLFAASHLDGLYPALKKNLNSYHRNCRLNTLKIINLYQQPLMKKDETHKSDEICMVARLCLDMEEIDATFKEYRDKINLIQKLNILTSTNRVPDLYEDFAPRMALGLLTVNLRPLWDESKKILITLSNVNKELYWDIMFDEINKFNDEKKLVCDGFAKSVLDRVFTPDQQEATNATKTGKISFECPTLNHFLYTENRSWAIMKTEQAQTLSILFAKLSHQEVGHMDFWNYYNLLLSTLKDTPTLTESKARHLVPIFFDFLNNEFSMTSEEDEEEDETEENQLNLLARNSKIIKSRMNSWLSIFSVFVNIKSIYRSQELNTAMMRLIAMGDAKLQIAALECIFAWKDPNVKPYADNLRNLLDDIKFRDELSTFIQNEEQMAIDLAHRDGLMPVVMRLLYGRLIQKSKASNKINKNSRRKAILSGISCCKINEIRYFVDLALAPFQSILDFPDTQVDEEGVVTQFNFDARGKDVIDNIPWRKQSGLLNLLEDMIKQFATHILPFLPDFIKVLLYIINYAQTRHFMEIDEDDRVPQQSSKSKEIRSLALKRFVDMFKINGNFEFSAYIPAIYTAYISERLENMPQETSQDLSTLTNLFLVWSKKSNHAVYLVNYDKRVLPQIIATLGVKKINANVLNALLEIIESLLDVCDNAMEVEGEVSLREKIIVPHVDLLLDDLKFRLTFGKDDVVFKNSRFASREIAIAARIAEYTTNGEQAASLLDLLLPGLNKPSRTIPERSKENIYRIWAKFIHIVPDFTLNSYRYNQYYQTASNLFSVAYSRASRQGLLDVFHAFSALDPQLKKVDDLLVLLNSYSPKRIDEPDYDKMLDALSGISETYYETFTTQQWVPILHQLIHCMHDTEEMAIRGSATHCVNQFLKIIPEKQDEQEKKKMYQYLNHIIYPAIKKGLRTRNELVRMEFISVLCSCVRIFTDVPIFADLVRLLGDGDEEVNFFSNIYHIQIHRRTRAMLRLSELAEKEPFSVSSVNNIFIPIITAFFQESDRTNDHNLLFQCSLTLSSLAKSLPWAHYYRLLQNYLTLVKSTDEKEKLYVRVVIGILDAFHFDLHNLELSDETIKNIMGRQKVRIDYLTNEEIHKLVNKDTEEVKAEEIEEVEVEKEEKTKSEKIHDVLISKVLPELNILLNNNKSRKSVIVRIPLALGITKLLCHLPEKTKRVNLPGLLTSICHIIRSRAQDVRDITRETLIKINAFLGPSYFSFMIKELRSALTKGYELHVLGYTINALLLDMMPTLKVGDLDYCVQDLVDILINDIFGAAGQEKDADEMTGKTKEAKSRRSPVSFEYIAKVTHFRNLGLLLVPLKDVMGQTQSSRILSKVDDVLRRISLGLVNNAEFESLELLDFSYGLIAENLEDFKAVTKTKKKKTQKELNFEVQMKRPTGEPVDYYRANCHRFVYFGLSIFSTALKKSKYDLSIGAVSDRFCKLVTAVGNTLYTNQTTNVVLAARIMCKLITLPIPNIPNAVPECVKRAFALIQASGSSKSSTVQVCIKLLTVCIRDNKKAVLNEAQLTYILNFVRPDMEDIERQGTIFALIRAIISRKFMAPEMYDIMDSVGRIMVTNQSKEIREQARIVYFTFLMDYPQGKNRLKQQMSFVITNLEYVYETGRESVLELLHHIITKFGDEILAPYIDSLFLALVMRLINDDSSKCREMSAALLKSLLVRSTDRMNTVYKLLNSWLKESSKPSLQRAACQVYGLVIDTFGVQVRPQIDNLLIESTAILAHGKELADELAAEQQADEDEDTTHMDVELEWEIVYYTINTFAKITKTFPKVVYSSATEPIWHIIQHMLLYPHSWIRSSVTRLYGVYFAGVDPINRMILNTSTPCSYLDKDTLRMLATDFLEQLKSNYLTKEQADQIVKNLFFIGKCFYNMPDTEDVEVGEPNEEIVIDDARDEVIEEESSDSKKVLDKINQEAHKRSLNWLFRKASFTARGAAIRRIKSGFILRASIFKWFAAMCNTMTPDQLPPYLMPVIAPIYRTVHEENKAEGFDELKQLGNEVLGLLQNKAGPSVYFAVYQRVRQQVLKAREDRKSKDAILAVSNPTLAAKRKLNRSAKSSANKKKRVHL
ncbi:armadillo-type protein [Pilobolus umbonatus]|nr:armadillo-type protein [Pilobolus umbonatus]